MLKVYECIIDEGRTIYKEFIPAKNKKELLKKWGCNGEFIKIKDVTSDYPISEKCVIEALQMRNFGQIEQDIIIRALREIIEIV